MSEVSGVNYEEQVGAALRDVVTNYLSTFGTNESIGASVLRLVSLIDEAQSEVNLR